MSPAAELTSAAMSLAEGRASRTISSRFGPSAKLEAVTPVMLAPGRFRLATSPMVTGSAPVSNTIGIVLVAACAASEAGALAGGKNTLTLGFNTLGGRGG